MVPQRSNGLRINRLSADYLSVASNVYTWKEKYEAPAVIKKNGVYFMFASQLTGWGMYVMSFLYCSLINGNINMLTHTQMQTITNIPRRQVLPGPGQHGRIVRKYFLLCSAPGAMFITTKLNRLQSHPQEPKPTDHRQPTSFPLATWSCKKELMSGEDRSRNLHILIVVPGTWVTDGCRATSCLPRMFPHILYRLPTPC